MSSDPERLVGQTIGQYRVVRLLGKGGMATVYEGRHVAINRTVAIKVLPRSFLHDDTFMQRFRREAEVIAQLEHFHILPIYDYGEYEGMPYIIMRYMEGGTLQDLIARNGPLPWDTILRIVSQVARALDYAHARGIVHRDIKPSNIMLDAQGNAYLSDFGIARMLEGTAQLTGSGIVGTPAYMAPEQSEPGVPTPAMDIYALGVTLFEMIAGRLPFVAETPIAQILMHVQRPVPSLREYNPDIPQAVDEVMQIAMAKRPEQRYSSAADLARALEAAVKSGGAWDWSPETLASLKSLDELRGGQVGVGSTKPPLVGSSGRRTVRRQPDTSRRAWLQITIGGGAVLIVGLIGIVLASLGAFGLPMLAAARPTATPTPSPANPIPSEMFSPTPTSLPTDTPTLTLSPTPTLTVTPTATPVPTDLPQTITLRGATMLLVPAGTFIMGNKNGLPRERPEHEVYLDAFYIDQYEVTNVFYMACVEAGACAEPQFINSPSQVAYYGAEYYYDYPLIYATWEEAQTYCKWRGGHLPTEAQWEKAARWDPVTGASHLFPWGINVLDPFYANYGSLYGHTLEVGSYSGGRSPIGAYDMAGNVAEWVYDWYQDNFYEVSPFQNPVGPESGQFKVFRGGSYESSGSALTATYRDYIGPGHQLPTMGFRCAWTPSGDPTQP